METDGEIHRKKEKHSNKMEFISDEEISNASNINKKKRKHRDRKSEPYQDEIGSVIKDESHMQKDTEMCTEESESKRQKKRKHKKDKDSIETNSKQNEIKDHNICQSEIETDKHKTKKCKKEKKSKRDKTDDLDGHTSIEHDSGLDIGEKYDKSVTEVKKKKSKKDKDKSTKSENKATNVVNTEEKVQAQNEIDDNFDPEEDPEKAAIRKKKREKRHAKKLEALKIKQEREARIGTAKASAIDYLNQWDKKRSEWKFMKVRQVWCLQNMFDTDQINDDTFEILLRYLKPLSGSAKTSTLTKAEKIIQQSEEETTEDGEMTVKADRARQIIQLLSD